MMPEDKWWSEFSKKIPLQKLRRYEVTNLTFEIIALYFTGQFTSHQANPIACMVLWAGVVALGFVCIVWASKQ